MPIKLARRFGKWLAASKIRDTHVLLFRAVRAVTPEGNVNLFSPSDEVSPIGVNSC